MQVKKFEAPTIQEALENVKRELGPEAIILQTRKNKRGFGLLSKGSVEVTAAVSERSLQKKKAVEVRIPEGAKEAGRNLPAEKLADIYDRYMERNLARAGQTQERVEIRGNSSSSGPAPASNPGQKKITATRYIDIADDGNSTENERPQKKAKVAQPQPAPAKPQIAGQSFEEEIKYLRAMVEELRNRGGGKGEGENPLQHTMLDVPALQDAFEQLVVSGVERRSVFALIKKVAFEVGPSRSNNPDLVFDLLADEIMESIEVMPPLPETSSKVTIALVGPTGVGKTTTIAKLASEAMTRRNLKVGLINLDGTKLGSFEQLGTFAKIIGVPFRMAGSEEDLKAALMDFKNLDVVLIDTAGRSQRDTSMLKEMQSNFDAIRGIVNDLRAYLVLSATTKDIELYDAASRFSVFRPQGIILSKLDEATVFGSIYNLTQRSKLPLISFTTGQAIPGDIEDATKERVVSLLMDV